MMTGNQMGWRKRHTQKLKARREKLHNRKVYQMDLMAGKYNKAILKGFTIAYQKAKAAVPTWKKIVYFVLYRILRLPVPGIKNKAKGMVLDAQAKEALRKGQIKVLDADEVIKNFTNVE